MKAKDTRVLLKRTTDEAKISVKISFFPISKHTLKAISWITGMPVKFLKYHYLIFSTW